MGPLGKPAVHLRPRRRRSGAAVRQSFLTDCKVRFTILPRRLAGPARTEMLDVGDVPAGYAAAHAVVSPSLLRRGAVGGRGGRVVAGAQAPGAAGGAARGGVAAGAPALGVPGLHLRALDPRAGRAAAPHRLRGGVHRLRGLPARGDRARRAAGGGLPHPRALGGGVDGDGVPVRRRLLAHLAALPVRNRLRVLRAERGWSQAELAARLAVSRQTVNAIETEKYDPSLPLAFKIARLFKSRIEEIFSEP